MIHFLGDATTDRGVSNMYETRFRIDGEICGESSVSDRQTDRHQDRKRVGRCGPLIAWAMARRNRRRTVARWTRRRAAPAYDPTPDLSKMKDIINEVVWKTLVSSSRKLPRFQSLFYQYCYNMMNAITLLSNTHLQAGRVRDSSTGNRTRTIINMKKVIKLMWTEVFITPLVGSKMHETLNNWAPHSTSPTLKTPQISLPRASSSSS